jgi:hypothetical protein
MALFQTSPSGYSISSNEDGSGQPLLGQRTFTVTSPCKGMAAGKRSRLDPEEETQLKEKYMEVRRASYTLTTEKDSEGSSKQRLTWLCCFWCDKQHRIDRCCICASGAPPAHGVLGAGRASICMQEVPGVRIQDAGLMLSLMLFSPASCYAMRRQVPAAPPLLAAARPTPQAVRQSLQAAALTAALAAAWAVPQCAAAPAAGPCGAWLQRLLQHALHCTH